MVDLTFDSVVGWIGLICLWIAIYLGYKENKQLENKGKFQYVKEDLWYKKNYIWIVFFRRAYYRPWASSLPYIVFIIPMCMMVLFHLVGLEHVLINGKAIKLHEMSKATGIVLEADYGRGRYGWDYIIFKDKNGNENEYRLCCWYKTNIEEKDGLNEFKKTIVDTKQEVTIWYRDERDLFPFMFPYKRLYELRVDNTPLNLLGSKENIFKYDYEWFKQRDENTIPNLIWWLKYSVVGWLWLWWLNKKELPIHRLNRIRDYKKNRVKDK